MLVKIYTRGSIFDKRRRKMRKKEIRSIITFAVGIVFFMSGCQTPVKPVSWKAAPNQGYTGSFSKNERLRLK
jgi:hypothetical protein